MEWILILSLLIDLKWNQDIVDRNSIMAYAYIDWKDIEFAVQNVRIKSLIVRIRM